MVPLMAKHIKQYPEVVVNMNSGEKKTREPDWMMETPDEHGGPFLEVPGATYFSGEVAAELDTDTITIFRW